MFSRPLFGVNINPAITPPAKAVTPANKVPIPLFISLPYLSCN
jgi:hypothetical protein